MPRPRLGDGSAAAQVWRWRNNLAVTLGHPDEAEVEWAELFREIRELIRPPKPVEEKNPWLRSREAVETLDRDWDHLTTGQKRVIRKHLRAFALRIKEDRPEG